LSYIIKKRSAFNPLLILNMCAKILDTLFASPIFSTTDFIRESGIPKPSAIRILHLLEKEEIISILRRGTGRKANILIFNKLIKIID